MCGATLQTQKQLDEQIGLIRQTNSSNTTRCKLFVDASLLWNTTTTKSSPVRSGPALMGGRADQIREALRIDALEDVL
jgi:hypothetical protein